MPLEGSSTVVHSSILAGLGLCCQAVDPGMSEDEEMAEGEGAPGEPAPAEQAQQEPGQEERRGALEGVAAEEVPSLSGARAAQQAQQTLPELPSSGATLAPAPAAPVAVRADCTRSKPS